MKDNYTWKQWSPKEIHAVLKFFAVKRNYIQNVNRSKENLQLYKKISTKYPTLFTSEREFNSYVKLYLAKSLETCLCSYCGFRISGDGIRAKHKYCSVKCAKRDPESKARTVTTVLRRYGVINVSQVKVIRDKINKSMSYPALKHQMQANREATFLYRYGVTSPGASKELQAKVRKTVKAKYGVTYILESPEIREKIKTTWLEKYGVDNPNKSKQVLFKKSKRYKKENYTFYLESLKDSGLELACSRKEFINNKIFQIKCLTCKKVFETQVYRPYMVLCPFCKQENRSNGEKSVANWISKLIGNNFQTNVKIDKWEVDIFIPEKKLAIEYHGLYWHSNVKIPYNRHQQKYLACKEKGITLIQIFENEWLEDRTRKIIKSLIKSYLDIHNSNKVAHARKCEVKEVNNEDYRKFLFNNHIQGYAPAAIKLGLYYENKLVSLIGIGKSRFKKGEVEVIRYCVKRGWKVSGSLGKLIKYFKQSNPEVKLLVSYIDCRFFNGNGYRVVGFTQRRLSRPNYWYFNPNAIFPILESRLKYQKHKLPGILDNFNPQLSEKENMEDNGYLWVYDAGSLRMEYFNILM